MEQLLDVKHLETGMKKKDKWIQLTRDISFEVREGETVGIVGESGCGKSLTALSVIRLLARGIQIKKGSILFQGKNLVEFSDNEMDEIRGNQISMIFQDTLSSLNPVLTIGNQLMEGIKLHRKPSDKKEEIRKNAVDLLKKVGLPRAEKIMKEYPFQLSGGMRQRAMIAMALSSRPKLLIADEPTTALDVTIQAQIVELLRELRKENKMSMLLISHDIGLVAELADRVIVMYAGEIVEEAEVYELFDHPKHPYTKALLSAVPSILNDKSKKLSSIPGSVPQDYDGITGCRFYPRCPYAFERCKNEHPELTGINGEHKVRCFAVMERV